MGDSNSDLIRAIVHYQQCLEKYTKRNDESRMLYCIGKLHKMPITVEHLEETGVGRTVNSLRKFNAEVGEAAKTLVAKWKEMVVSEENDSKDANASNDSKNSRQHTKDKTPDDRGSSSSHKECDKSTKHKTSSSSHSNHVNLTLKNEEHVSKHKSHKKEKDNKHHKHKSSKRSHSSDKSDSEDNDDVKSHSKNYKLSKSSDRDNSYKSRDFEETKSNKEKSHKRKREDKDEISKSKKIKSNYKKYSDTDESDKSDFETKEEILLQKHHSKPTEVPHSLKIKNKHKSKDRDEQMDNLDDHKSKKSSRDQKKDKHSDKEMVKNISKKNSKDDSSRKSLSKHRSHENINHKSPSKSSSKEKKYDGIGSYSGTSFADALGMLEPTTSKTNKKKSITSVASPVNDKNDLTLNSEVLVDSSFDLLKQKKLEPLDINIATLLPEITPNYRPLGNNSLDVNNLKNNKLSIEEEALSAIMSNKISRTKVYSGNKVIWGKVPSLFELCSRVLQDNLDALEYTGGVPYSILKPVIERATPDQLYMLEHHNPYLIDDTDELWQLHCQKEFRTKRREELENWRDMYMRCLDEREAKLKALTANIKQSQDKSLPVRQTKLAYVEGHSIVKPPRNVARQQAKHGTGGVEKKPIVTPSSRLSAIASAGIATQVSVPNPAPRTAAGNSTAAVKPKKAPLMQKTLAFMKNRMFRR